jgi:hypothetical protein
MQKNKTVSGLANGLGGGGEGARPMSFIGPTKEDVEEEEEEEEELIESTTLEALAEVPDLLVLRIVI